MAKAKAKTQAANVRVPQSREEPADFVRDIGVAQRTIVRIEADMNDAIAQAKSAGETQAAAWKSGIAAMTEGLRIWCEANRSALTDGNKTKSADLGTGTVGWRFQRAKVTVTGVEDVIDFIIKAGVKLRRFVRIKTELNREAMLDAPILARTIPGVSIGSDGESFSVEPFEAALETASAGL